MDIVLHNLLENTAKKVLTKFEYFHESNGVYRQMDLGRRQFISDTI